MTCGSILLATLIIVAGITISLFSLNPAPVVLAIIVAVGILGKKKKK